MAFVGILYLTFEKKLLTRSILPRSSATVDDSISRSLVGFQVRSITILPTYAYIP